MRSKPEDESPLAQLEDSDIVPLDELVARRMLREAMDRALEEFAQPRKRQRRHFGK